MTEGVITILFLPYKETNDNTPRPAAAGHSPQRERLSSLRGAERRRNLRPYLSIRYRESTIHEEFARIKEKILLNSISFFVLGKCVSLWPPSSNFNISFTFEPASPNIISALLG